jgi:hypothetical protein
LWSFCSFGFFLKKFCVYILGCLCGTVENEGQEQQIKEERDEEEKQLEDVSIL